MSKSRIIGILTLYRVRNIGACLQALATKMVLEEMGYKAVYIVGYGKKMAKALFKGDMGVIKPWYIPFLIVKEYKFRRFFRVYNEISIDDIKNNVDGIIIGSDSIWISGYGENALPDAYWGNIDCENIRAYAPSVGGSYDISNYDDSLFKYLKKIKTITARDKYTSCFIQESIGLIPELVLDPTLLVDWNTIAQHKIVNNKSKYIVIYGPLSKEALLEIKRFARRENCKLINIGGFNRRVLINKVVDPFEFLGYIKGAEYVFTSMFHGVMLSLALNKQFKFIPRLKNRVEKVQSVFEILDIDSSIDFDKCLDNDKSFSWGKELDYASINKTLSEEREKSKKMIDEWFS